MWTVAILPDPLLSQDETNSSHHHRHHQGHHHHPTGVNTISGPAPSSTIVSATVSIAAILGRDDQKKQEDFATGGRGARVALADCFARGIAERGHPGNAVELDGVSYHMEPLDRALTKNRRRKASTSVKYPPYILERSDIWCSEEELHVTCRMAARQVEDITTKSDNAQPMALDDEKKSDDSHWEQAAKSLLFQLRKNIVGNSDDDKLMEQVACVALQHKLRSKVAEMKAVAFVADGAILPRKSGTSDAPMASPPAVPFKAPPDSIMSQELSIEMGTLSKYLPSQHKTESSTLIQFRGLLVPAGITLICGGGYHGKSTLLQTIATGIYDKIPGDGREYCVAVPDAVSVRAEDGRYVNNCNISAFISNLPTPPGVTKVLDTKHFSTRDSSGSTSQAANVAEAIEMGATAMLVDEDISAANFMARDGRMRALVMDESITPLLYRVNGLYNTMGISSVVVVGGVGDWLDIPHNVILLDKYVASDATKKAQSISYQFSHGHVQYGGKGVVHRLEWKNSGTPIPRRPVDSFSQRYARDIFISIMDGGHALSLHQENDDDESDMDCTMDDDDEGCIEASRLEQLLGRKQLFGCGLCALWILQVGAKDASIGLPDLLNKLDSVLDKGGIMQVLSEVNSSTSGGSLLESSKWKNIVEEVGFVHRPRKYEIGQALTRMYGVQMEEIEVEGEDEEAAAEREAELKRQELLKVWENRRAKKGRVFL
jgi:hypothetical protein